ncbi:DHHA1 domain-containing protein [Candidatus Pyrohabitans sp.]
MDVRVFIHGDTDGVCSGALTVARYPRAEIWFSHPTGFLKDLREFPDEPEGKKGLFVICDIAISEKDKFEIFKELERIGKNWEVVYIDHHPLPLETLSGDIPCHRILSDTSRSSSELTYQLFRRGIFRDGLDRDMERVALFGAISDFNDGTDFISTELNYFDKRTIYMEAGILSQSLGDSKFDYDFKKMVVRNLAKKKMPSQIDEVVARAIRATKKEWKLYDFVNKHVELIEGMAVVRKLPKGVSPTKAAKFAIGKTGAGVGLCMVRRNGHYDITFRRHADFPVDLNETLRLVSLRFEGSGGGHPAAAGARIPGEHLEDFLITVSREFRTKMV